LIGATPAAAAEAPAGADTFTLATLTDAELTLIERALFLAVLPFFFVVIIGKI
jgi:hypothetical protein